MEIPTKLELAWMAGFFDGEGCIQIGVYNNKWAHKSYYKRRVCVANTDINSLYIFKKYFGGSIYESSFSKKYPTHRTVFYWVAATKQSYDFIKAIYPYLRTKKEKADLYIMFQNCVTFKHVYFHDSKKTNVLKQEEVKRRDEIVNRLRVLNRRGKEKSNLVFQYNS